jgi:hypothetical protein
MHAQYRLQARREVGDWTAHDSYLRKAVIVPKFLVCFVLVQSDVVSIASIKNVAVGDERTLLNWTCALRLRGNASISADTQRCLQTCKN